MASEPTQSDIAEQLRELADEIEGSEDSSSSGDGDGLPRLQSQYSEMEMVEKVPLRFGLDVYIDSVGSVWFGSGDKSITELGIGWPAFLFQHEIDKIRTASERVKNQ